jgi:hypothetical protein
MKRMDTDEDPKSANKAAIDCFSKSPEFTLLIRENP